MTSKTNVDPLVATAASVAYAKKQFKKLEEKLTESEQHFEELLEQFPVIEGPQGPRGDKGETGERGERGFPGIKGDQGPKGDTGERGEIGPAGPAGEKGDKGDKGDPGTPGENGVPGERGIQGERGEAGEKGERGDRGPRGERGPQGEQGLKGDQGEKGEPGEKGEQGERGPQGEKGPRGEKGAKGDRGPEGKEGKRGPKGEKGDQGPKGDEGETPNIKPLLEQYEKRFNQYVAQTNQRITAALTAAALGGGGGGSGSYSLLDQADVEFKQLAQVANNAILIFDPSVNKFTALSIVDVINSLKDQLDLEAMKYTKLVDEDGVFTYIGEATPGTAQDAATWRIRRVDATNDPDLDIEWADGTAEFTKVWDDRATYTYS